MPTIGKSRLYSRIAVTLQASACWVQDVERQDSNPSGRGAVLLLFALCRGHAGVSSRLTAPQPFRVGKAGTCSQQVQQLTAAESWGQAGSSTAACRVEGNNPRPRRGQTGQVHPSKQAQPHATSQGEARASEGHCIAF